MSRIRYRRLAAAVQAGLLVGALGLFQPVEARGGDVRLPTGGLSNTARISVNGSIMTVDGQAANNVIAWESFNVGRDATVAFGGTKNYLNYVAGISPSEIYGTLTWGAMFTLLIPMGLSSARGRGLMWGIFTPPPGISPRRISPTLKATALLAAVCLTGAISL